jgi:hypothetical protein
MIADCPKCQHQSSSDLEAYQHWLDHLWDGRQPVVEKGMLVTVIGPDGQQFTDRVTDVEVNRRTGEQKIKVGDGEDKVARAMALIQNVIDTTNLLLKPRWVPLWAWKVWLKIRR